MTEKDISQQKKTTDRKAEKQPQKKTEKQQKKQPDRKTGKQQKKSPGRQENKETLSSKQRREQEVHHAKVIIACAVIALLVILFLIFILPILTGSKTVNKGKLTGVNSDVLQYENSVEAYCKEYHISQFSTLMLAIMQQESSGQGTDIFQCSESPFNTEYPNTPGSITDTDYSIRVGVETFAYCLDQAGCKRISDMEKVKLALQEYNFGNDYVNWAVSNYGGYSQENAYEFSEKMKAELGWDTYGDPEYVQHVLQYYTQ
ncbi:MAG: lysozyme family protein [Eubacteriales bacterium]|nr:lysozyme family protein [Eubacteriales bacterium]